MNKLVLLVISIALPAFAEPRDVRRILAENGFKPDVKIEGDVIGYPEPSILAWQLGRPDDDEWRYEFDPLPTIFTFLSGAQAQGLAGILSDRMIYNPRLGGKLCGGFHADVAIRIPGSEASLYVLLCFTCNEIRLLQRGAVVASADMDRGRNRLLQFLRDTFPKNKRFTELKLDSPVTLTHDWTKDLLEWSKTMIPDDPLLKRVLALKPDEISQDDLEELDARCNAREREMQQADRRRNGSTTPAPAR